MCDRNIKGLNFDINDEKELSDYMELTFKSLLGEKANNINNLLYKIGLNMSNNDISKADIHKGKRPRYETDGIVFLNKMFIDNVVLSSISTKSRKKDDIGYYNIIIRNHFKQIYNNKKIRVICIAESNNNELLTKGNIKKFQDLTNAKLKNEKDKFKSMDYLMKLNDIDKDKAIHILTGDELKGLNNQGVYINNIDYTIDLGFSFDSDKLIEEMTEKLGFHFEGELNLRIIEEDYKNNVSFWLVDEETDIKIRVKIYNKFIQSMESPAVRKLWGSHLLHWINNDNKQLNEATYKSLNYGYSRLEMTFYIETIPNDDLINRSFNYVYDNIIKEVSNDAIFYNTINNQFTEIMKKVDENLFIYDKTKKQLLQIRWINSLSQKMNAILFKNIGYSSNRMINILGRFTFNNKPIKMVMIEYDKYNHNDNTDEDDVDNDLIIEDNEGEEDKKICFDKNQQVKINVRTYLKDGYNYTNLTDTNENYSITKHQNQPKEMGIDYEDMNFRIPTEINNNELKEDFKHIFFKMIVTDKKIEYLQLKNIKVKTTKSNDMNRIYKTELLNEQVERFKISSEIKNEEFKKYQLKRLININKLNEIDNHYKLTTTTIKSLKDYNVNDIFSITVFIKRGENQIIFYDCMRNEWIYGNKQICEFINTDIFVKYYKYIHYKEFDERKIYYFLNINDDIDYLATATLIKKTVNKNKDKIYLMKIINHLTNEEIDNNIDDNNINDNNINETYDDDNNDDDIIYEIKYDINRINTLSIEKLDLMEDYEIIGIKKQPYRHMFHYFLHLRQKKEVLKYNHDDVKIFCGNQWMREIFDKIDVNKLIGAKPLKFKVLQTKRSTKTKTSENLIEVDDNIINQYKL